MIQLKPGDVVAIQRDDYYYYAIILSSIIYFGGNIVYAFHTKSDKLFTLNELIQAESKGFNAVVDFIFAKRENRITILGRTQNFSEYRKHQFYKNTVYLKEKAKSWHIYNDKFKDIETKKVLSLVEKEYPLSSRFDDTIMINKINNNWLPELDERI